MIVESDAASLVERWMENYGLQGFKMFDCAHLHLALRGQTSRNRFGCRS